MKLNFRNLPIANLPYEDVALCKQMMLRLYENIPYLAELPKIDPNDNIINRTVENIPGITYKDKKLIIEDYTTTAFNKALQTLDDVYNSVYEESFEPYSSSSPFWDMYVEMLKRIKPQYTIIRLLGPFSFAETVFNVNTPLMLKEKSYRKYIIQALGVKAQWFINKIKSISPGTKLIILFEEQQLYKYGTLKRNDESITKELIVTLFTKLYQKIQNSGGIVGVQSFEKCNWQLVLESNVNLISFDAYNNPNSLNIVADKLGHFLAKGGYINWGVIPANNENSIRGLNIDFANKLFIKAIEDLSAEGVSLDMLFKNCTVSVQGNLVNIPILFAEKALMIESQLAKKIPASSRQ